jgi:hypothetical protein
MAQHKPWHTTVAAKRERRKAFVTRAGQLACRSRPRAKPYAPFQGKYRFQPVDTDWTESGDVFSYIFPYDDRRIKREAAIDEILEQTRQGNLGNIHQKVDVLSESRSAAHRDRQSTDESMAD